MKAAVFDVDGVLIYSVERYNYAVTRAGCTDCPRFWRLFLDPRVVVELDRPRLLGVELARLRAFQGIKILVVTGRPENLRRATLAQLREAGIRPARLLMRGPGDSRPEPVVKRDAVETLIYEGYEVAEIHDDNVDSLHAAGGVARSATLVLHSDDTCMVYRRGLLAPPNPCRG